MKFLHIFGRSTKQKHLTLNFKTHRIYKKIMKEIKVLQEKNKLFSLHSSRIAGLGGSGTPEAGGEAGGEGVQSGGGSPHGQDSDQLGPHPPKGDSSRYGHQPPHVFLNFIYCFNFFHFFCE